MVELTMQGTGVRRRTLRYQTTLLVLMFADMLGALATYGAAFTLRIYISLPFTVDLLPSMRLAEVHHPLFLLTATQIILLYFFGFYDLHGLVHRTRLMSNVAAALGVQMLAISAWYFFRGDLSFPRSVLILFWVLNTLAVAGLRAWVVHWLARVRALRVVLIGVGESLAAFLAGLPDMLHLPGLTIVGVVSIDGRKPDSESPRAPWLGSVEELPQVMRRHEIDEVIFLSQPTWKDAFIDWIVRESRGWQEGGGGRPRVLVVPSVYDILVGRVTSLRLHDVPLVEVLKDPQEDLAFLVKEIVDIGLAAVLLLCSAPIVGIAALLVKVTSPGPVLYRQRRVGRDGKEFIMYKLRTMVEHAEAETGPVLATGPADERITRVGRVLRATRIDEIPQLFNILNGTMSLVGPRPERPEFVSEFLRIPGYAERLQVKPGLTGWAQVNGEYHTSPEYKLKYDLAYIYNYSLWLDIRIMTETVKVMLTRRGM